MGDDYTPWQQWAELPGFKEYDRQYPDRTDTDVGNAYKAGGDSSKGVIRQNDPASTAQAFYLRDTDQYIFNDNNFSLNANDLRGHERGHRDYAPTPETEATYTRTIGQGIPLDKNNPRYSELYARQPGEQYAEAARIAREILQAHPDMWQLASDPSRSKQLFKDIDNEINTKIVRDRSPWGTILRNIPKDKFDQQAFKSYVYNALHRGINQIWQYGDLLAQQPNQNIMDAIPQRGAVG